MSNFTVNSYRYNKHRAAETAFLLGTSPETLSHIFSFSVFNRLSILQ